MLKTFTKKYITEHSGCYAPDKENKLHKCSFMNTPGYEVSIAEIMNSEIPYKDKFWFIVKHSKMTMPQREELAKNLLEELRLIREEKYGASEAVNEFIQVAKEYVDHKISYCQFCAADRKCGGGGVVGVGGVCGVDVVGVVGVGGVVGVVIGDVVVVGVGVSVGVGGVGVGGERLLNQLQLAIDKAP